MPNFEGEMAKVKKYELVIEDECTLDVFGVSSAFADYRLAWELNQCLDLNLTKANDAFEIRPNKAKELVPFRYFSYFDEECLSRFYLIKNKQENGAFQVEHPMIDYFFVARENYSFEKGILLEKLRKINGIVAVFDFPTDDFDMIAYLTS
jgi:hypothetical protein